MPYELSRRLGAGPLLCDGAMGTLLYARGVSVDACFDVLNLNNPRVIQSIHADYIAAGVDCIETNTFVPVLVGILPLHRARHAEFLHNEVPGITIPEPIRRRLREAGDGALRAGIEMAQELVRAVRQRYAGAYLMPSFGRFEVVAEVLDAIR